MASLPRDDDRWEEDQWGWDDEIELGADGPVILPFPADEPVILPFDDPDRDELIDIDPTKPLPPMGGDPWADVPW